MPSVNGYVAFFDVSVCPSNSDNDDEDDDDEGEEKEEKHDDDEERLALRLYLFFSRSPSPSLQPSLVSLCTFLSYSFISFLLPCSMNEVGRGLLRFMLRSMYSFTTTFATNGGCSVTSFSGRLKIRKTQEN